MRICSHVELNEKVILKANDMTKSFLDTDLEQKLVTSTPHQTKVNYEERSTPKKSTISKTNTGARYLFDLDTFIVWETKIKLH